MSRRVISRVPLGLLGMLLLIVAVESQVARRWLDVGERRALAWRFGGEASETLARRAEVLCLGDSLVKLGVQSIVLEGRLGRPVYNIALPGGQASSTYFLLRRALDAGASPSTVVVDFHPNLLAAAPRFNVDVWPELLRPHELIDLALQARDPNLFASTALRAALPSYKDRQGIRQVVGARLIGQVPTLRDEHAGFVRNWRVNSGSQLVPDLSNPNLSEWSTSGGPEGRHWKPHRANAVYLAKFLDLCTDRSIQVVWILPPLSPSWQAHRDAVGIEVDYDRFLHGLVERHENLVVLDARRSGYVPQAFRDATHLNRRGASTFSDDLGLVLANALERPLPPSSRWLPMPTYHDPTNARPLEDVDQSRAIARDLERDRRE